MCVRNIKVLNHSARNNFLFTADQDDRQIPISADHCKIPPITEFEK